MKFKFFAITILLIPFLAFAQDAGKKKAYYFFGEQCPHCKTVDEYFQSNGIYEKYEITKLDATSNPFNGKLFLEFGKAFGAPDWGGVPAIVFGNEYLLGDKPIIDNFEKEIDASNDANELPDPAKIAKVNGSTNPSDTTGADRQNQVEADDNGNKKNYFPVIMVALIAVVGGALIYINRKKA